MIDIDRLVSGLQKPEAYPFAVDAIECLQTHISWVFLAGPFAYKVKKPVNFEFLDYSTLERRRFYCEEEVRLNRRLAPDVYLGVVPIALAGGQARVEGKGRAVEYAVKMMRLSAERMLDSLLRAGKAGEADVRRLAHIIADFHARAETGAAVERFGSPEAIMGNWRQNFEQMRPYLRDTISAEEMRSCEVFVADELSRRQDLFLAGPGLEGIQVALDFGTGRGRGPAQEAHIPASQEMRTRFGGAFNAIDDRPDAGVDDEVHPVVQFRSRPEPP